MPAEPTYTYSYDPATDLKDAVRALLADTNPNGQGFLLSDQEILWAITNEGSQYMAAAQCAEMIAALYTGPKRNLALRVLGDLRIQYGRTARGAAEDWYAVAKALRRRAGRAALPAAGGVEVEDRQDRDDQSLLQPDFVRGMDDFQPTSAFDYDGTGISR